MTWIGVVPAFVLGAAALVMRRRREARAIGGGIDMDDLPELEKMVTRRQVPEDVTQRRQALALVHWRQHRSRRTWPFGLAAVTVVYLALGIVLALAGHRAAGIVFAVLGLLVIGGGGYLLVRFGQRRMERYEAQLGAAH
ncbi:hypothetical protein [Streptomyces sp. NPDC048643]|uniref:hypothetical protein n=1 Tax=Streptomyces sp. NPDC048643 TaxID=3155637 RepID=UPI0034345B7C